MYTAPPRTEKTEQATKVVKDENLDMLHPRTRQRSLTQVEGLSLHILLPLMGTMGPISLAKAEKSRL